ncbi:hypothetical protein HG530_006691 [Fusarium avenaceum]|nr:hypothetical protein HG530_006691 [Fusarium avenaceum]
MVHQSVLVKVKVRRIARVQSPEFTGQLEHVVGIASLAGVVGQILGNRIRGAEVLGLTVSSDCVCVLMDGQVPCVTADVEILLVTRDLVLAKSTDPLGDLGVGVQPRQFIDVLRKRIKDLSVVKALSNFEPLVVFGVVGDIGEDFVHAAELSLHHLLHLSVAHLSGTSVDPAS